MGEATPAQGVVSVTLYAVYSPGLPLRILKAVMIPPSEVRESRVSLDARRRRRLLATAAAECKNIAVSDFKAYVREEVFVGLHYNY